MGNSARKVRGTVRLTPTEAAALVAEFGSLYKALRTLVTNHLRGPR